jgi:hypothetical protein
MVVCVAITPVRGLAGQYAVRAGQARQQMEVRQHVAGTGDDGGVGDGDAFAVGFLAAFCGVRP